MCTAAAIARRYGMEFTEALGMTMRIWGAARSAVLSMGRDDGERWRGLSRDEKAEVCGAVVRALLDVER